MGTVTPWNSSVHGGKSVPDWPLWKSVEFANTLASCTFPGQPTFKIVVYGPLQPAVLLNNGPYGCNNLLFVCVGL